MKYILTESQYRRLQENNSRNVGFFQDLINQKLDYIVKYCNEMESEEFPRDIGFQTCDEVDSIENIRVTDVQFVKSSVHPYKKSDESSLIIINLMIDYRSIKYVSFDNLIWDLKQMIKNQIKFPVDIHFEINNLSKNFNR
jgi:hypothetical protein